MSILVVECSLKLVRLSVLTIGSRRTTSSRVSTTLVAVTVISAIGARTSVAVSALAEVTIGTFPGIGLMMTN
jgi:hypothetical protein